MLTRVSVQRAARLPARAKEGIHPQLFKSKVIVNGETVDEITGTQEEYHVDVWSGNHPFYQGDSRALVLDEGQARPLPLHAASRPARVGAFAHYSAWLAVVRPGVLLRAPRRTRGGGAMPGRR